MQNPKNKNKKANNNPFFKAGYNIVQRVNMDEKMRNYSEYAQR